MKAIIFLLVLGACCSCLAAVPEPGLLFYLSGDHEFAADYAAGGEPTPNFLRDVKIISDGAKGPGFECANTQLMSYWGFVRNAGISKTAGMGEPGFSLG